MDRARGRNSLQWTPLSMGHASPLILNFVFNTVLLTSSNSPQFRDSSSLPKGAFQHLVSGNTLHGDAVLCENRASPDLNGNCSIPPRVRPPLTGPLGSLQLRHQRLLGGEEKQKD